MTGNNTLGKLTRAIRPQAIKYNNNKSSSSCSSNNNTPHTLCKKKYNLIKQKYMTQETATQNVRKQLQPSIPNKKAEEL